MKKKFLIFFIFAILFLEIHVSLAITKPKYLPNANFSYSVWIPYWARWGGVDELLATNTSNGLVYNSNFNSNNTNSSFFGATTSKMNIDKIDIISPFTFEVDGTGAFLDKGKMNQDAFDTLIKIAQAKKIKIYPTVLWGNAEQMSKVLADKDLQQAILSDIEYYLNKYNLDGIDIDFEGKKSSTKDNFSSLLKLLSTSLHKKNKGMICTIEARTPLVDNYLKLTKKTITNVEFANDYSVIGKYCDQVRIMAYDQMGSDMSLNNQNKNTYYRPVADINWVERVIKNTITYGIPANKIVLGVATYGYKFEVSTSTATTTNINTPDKYGSILLNNQSKYSYSRIGSINYSFADQLAKSLNINPTRNNGGELEFSYSSTTDISNSTPGVLKTYYVEYSDSKAIEQKISLAKKYKLAGISIFKIDGNNDHNIWNIIKR
jgi:spore germination protein YaaH